MNLYDLIVIKPNFVPEFIINNLLKLTSQGTSPATVKEYNSSKVTDYRSTKWVAIPVPTLQNLIQTVYNIHESELKKVFNTKLKDVEPTQFLKYEVNDKYGDHNDCEDWGPDGKLQRVVNRDISVIMYLNDDYEGGEFEFTKLGLTIKPKRGMMIAFPSYFEFSHQAHPVKSGTRYALASWIETVNRVYNRDDELSTSQQSS